MEELEIIDTKVITPLSLPAAESFVSICKDFRTLKELLSNQGEVISLGNLCLSHYVLPYHTAPYPGKSKVYKQVIESVAEESRKRLRDAVSG